MFYIPKDWIKNKNNELLIHKILEDHIFTDINLNVEEAIKQLEIIEETIVIENIRDNTLVMF